MKEKGIRKLVKRNIAIGMLLGMFLNTLTFADELIKTRDGSTARVITAPNGTKMIELVNPNALGISINDFDRLSVDEKNLILNNISPKEGTGYRSELGGIIAPNENYTGNPARAVLIRVHRDPSVINGFIEAASTGRVDMIWSNPNGMYLNGGLAGRFGNVSFTTGHVSDDLMTIMVRDGRIEIGSSFNGNAAENLSLLAKSIQVNGQLNGNDLTLIGGQYDYNTGTKEVVKQGENPGEVLISSSVVGSIYGRNIYLKAVGSDIGVKGDVVSQKLLKINVDGTLVVSKIQGTASVELKAKEFTQEGSTYSEGNIKIDADKVALKGAGTQGNNIEITGILENSSNLYGKGNVTLGNNVKSTGQILSEKNLNINGNLDSSNIVYGKENINISGYFFNTSDMQSEGNITIGGNTTNTGRILADNILHINGTTLNEGILYGKNKINLQTLTNSGNIQTAGDILGLNATNTGKVIAEGNISILDLDNQNELITNKILTTNNLTNTGALSTGEGITSNGNVINYGELKTNGNFTILGNLNNYNLLNTGGLLSTRDLINHGNLKAVEKILTRGTTFYNQGEILTSNLDVDNTNIQNTNKITVVGDAKLKGNTIDNQGNINVINLDMLSPVLLNSGEISASEKIKANNTSLTNTGKLISNDKIDLNNSTIVNRSTIESTTVNLGNLLSYDNNTGLIRGNNVTLSTSGNLILEGKIQGIDNLLISGLDVTNNGITIGSGLLRLSGKNINNNSEKTISGLRVELLGTGNILNEGMIEGETGLVKGLNITNKDLMMFLTKLDIEGTKLINNNASIYSDAELNIRTLDVDNIGGEIVGQSELKVSDFNLLDNTNGIIDSRGNILLSGNKLLNGGQVSGKYRLYWVTWDGQKIYEETWRDLNDDYMQQGGKVFVKEVYDPITGDYLYTKYDNWHFSALDNWELSEKNPDLSVTTGRVKEKVNELNAGLENKLYYDGNKDYELYKKYETKVLEGHVDTSKLETKGGRILSGGNLTLDVKELVNKNSKISAGGTLTITDKAEKIENTTDVANIKVYDGNERFSYTQSETNSAGTTKYGYYIKRTLDENVRDYNIADGVSVIEGNNVIIQGTPTINNGYDYSQIGTGAVVDLNSITSKDVDVDLYYDPLTVHVDQSALEQIVKEGVIPFNNSAFSNSLSKLFTESKDPTSKYLMETRSQYIDLNKFYGSDYFLSKIGYNESSDWNRARRLGDAYYETKYMNNLLLETLGTRFINGKADRELMKNMLDNAVSTSGDLKLTVGIALTKEQVSALKSDIIWYVEQEVNGEKVLVPQVYLSQATLENIKSPTTTIAAQDTLDISSGNLVNQGRLEGKTVYIEADNIINKSVGELRAEIVGDNVSIDVKKDILNIGATIGAKEDLFIEAGGTISNITTAVETTEHDRLNGKERIRVSDDIQNVGLISGGDKTYISGDKYVSRGAVTESGGATYIEANDISLNTIALKDFEITNERNGYDLSRTTEKVGSEVTGKDYVVMDATNDINIKGSKVASDGTVQLTAENDINIVNDKNTMYTESKREKKGTFSSYSKLETDYKESAVASTIIGNNVILDATNDIKIQASNVIAVKDNEGGGNIMATAGNDIKITTDDMNNEYHLKEKKKGWSASASTGGGGGGAGVSYSKSKLEIDRTNVTVATSSIISEGNTILDAGNKVRTEAMQANIGENLVIKGKNGVDLLDAQEVYEDKVKQKTTTVGVTVSVGSTVTSFIDQANGMYNKRDKYGTGNPSQLINSAGDGLTLFRSGVSAFNDGQAIFDKLATGIHPANALSGISANASVSFSQSKYESNTSGTNSVAGTIKVGNNFIIQSDGDVKLVNQKVTVGDNFVVDAKNFEARAGENTYNNDTKSSSTGGNIGYDFASQTMTGGANVGRGNSNASSKTYDNTVINVGGTFQLTTKEDALFAGANVTADKINFDIGRDLSIISLQDEYKSEGKNYGAGLGYSEKNTTTNKREIGSATGNLSYSQNNSESKWVSDQTSIIANNGGNVKVDGTLTNVGSIIGSLSNENKLSIEANKVVVENLQDYNRVENIGANVGGIGLNNKAPIGQTGVQYGSHDKEQNSNATFVNTEVTEAGKKLNLEEMGINTDINKAQVVTKDEVVEQIDTNLHTDLLNTTTRKQLADDVKKAGEGLADIGASLSSDKQRYEEAREGRYSQYYKEQNPEFADFLKNPDKKSPEEMEQLTKDYVKYMTGKDVDVIITATGEGSGYIRGDQLGEGKKDVFVWDLKQLADGGSVTEIIGHETNHIDDHRRDRESHNEADSNSLGGRFKENLGEDGVSNGFNLGNWLSQGDNLNTLLNGADKLDTEYVGYEVEKSCYPAGDPKCYKNADPNYLNNAKAARERAKGENAVEKTLKQMEEINRKIQEEKEKTKYMGSPGLLNSSEKQKKKDNLVEAVSNIKKRFPDKTDKEILDALNNWNVTPTKDGRIKIEIDGQLVFRVDNYDNNLGAYYALSSDDGLGIISGGLYSLSKVVQTKAEGNYVMDFSGDFVSLEMQGALVAEGIAAQKYNSKLQEMKNLNKPLEYKYLDKPKDGGTINIGSGKNPTEGAYNIDFENYNSNIGVHKGDATNLSNVKTGSQSKVIIDNPYKYDPLNSEVVRVTQKGGTIELTGTDTNKFVKGYLKMTDEEFSKIGFEVLKRDKILSEGYFTTSGEQIKNSILEKIILKKK